MKEKHTIVIKIEGNKMVDFIQLSYGEVMRMPTDPIRKTFPTKDLIVFLYDVELHLELKPGGLKGKALKAKNFIRSPKYKDPEFMAPLIKSLLDSPDTTAGFRERLLKEIAETCAVPRKNFKKK